MPHKHKRRQKDSRSYDLPPSLVAKPLPTRELQSKPSNKTNKKKNADQKTKFQRFETQTKNGLNDDTPKAFRRLMQYQEGRANKHTPTPSDPDTGETRKRKRGATDGKMEGSTGKKKSASASATCLDNPKILPGEKLSDFAARVDRELPLSDMKRSNNPTASDVPKLRGERLTKHERRLRRLQRQWREEEERIQERENEEKDEREANMDDQNQLWKQWEAEAGKKKKAPATKKRKGEDDGGSDADDDPDPWAKLNRTDRVNKPANPFDVVQAPPQLTKAKGKFKVRGGARVDVANIPSAVGSLRRREELAGERRNVVEEYRRLMAEKRT
ncbi:hypothetical protein PHISP_01588 [Aspergillus sp. HF37]|nr:hypothetical protein PHISP_01588 [Aspergillus sp. HF37]